MIFSHPDMIPMNMNMQAPASAAYAKHLPDCPTFANLILQPCKKVKKCKHSYVRAGFYKLAIFLFV